jgi:hypothetical protein
MAGGKFGRASVFAWEITFNVEKKKWNVTDKTFYTAGWMHAANEMIWFHNDEVNGFPEF